MPPTFFIDINMNNIPYKYFFTNIKYLIKNITLNKMKKQK